MADINKLLLSVGAEHIVENFQPPQFEGELSVQLQTLYQQIIQLDEKKYDVPPYSAKYKPPIIHVIYDNTQQLTFEQQQAVFKSFKENSVAMRKLSLVAGVINAMNFSDNFLNLTGDKKNSLVAELMQKANAPSNVQNIKNEIKHFVKDITAIIAKHTPERDQQKITRKIRNSERYFIAEFQRILVNETKLKVNCEVKTQFQIDVPFGNKLTVDQKKEYIKIHEKNKPTWFNVLAKWEQDWLKARVPKNFNDDWNSFEKINQTSAMQQIPGLKNARFNYFIEEKSDGGFERISESIKTATLVPYEMPKEIAEQQALENAKQLLAIMTERARKKFDEFWKDKTNKPERIKTLLFIQSLLSDIGRLAKSDTWMSDIQKKAIRQVAEKYKKDFFIVADNEVVNILRMGAPQIKRRWAYVDSIMSYYENYFKDKLEHPDFLKAKLLYDVLASMRKQKTKLKFLKNRNFHEMKTATAEELVSAMAGLVSDNCKSGKDRTGMDEIYRLAINQYYRSHKKMPNYYDNENDRNNFIEIFMIYFKSMKTQHSAGDNTFGAFGLKDDAPMLCNDAKKKLGGYFENSNALASLNKPKKFKKDEKLESQEKKNILTLDEDQDLSPENNEIDDEDDEDLDDDISIGKDNSRKDNEKPDHHTGFRENLSDVVRDLNIRRDPHFRVIQDDRGSYTKITNKQTSPTPSNLISYHVYNDKITTSTKTFLNFRAIFITFQTAYPNDNPKYTMRKFDEETEKQIKLAFKSVYGEASQIKLIHDSKHMGSSNDKTAASKPSSSADKETRHDRNIF